MAQWGFVDKLLHTQNINLWLLSKVLIAILWDFFSLCWKDDMKV